MQDYQKIYKLQDKILEFIYKNLQNMDSGFYLTGGTALNRFYSPIRYSDDLDFFAEDNSFFRENYRVIRGCLSENTIKNNWRLEINIDSRDFVRIFVSDKNNTKLQVDFVNDRVFRYGKSLSLNIDSEKYIKLDNLKNILANKITAIISRDSEKDIVDLITIIYETDINFTWDEIFQIAQKKENFEIAFFIQRLKTFPINNIARCRFLNLATPEIYKNRLPELIEKINNNYIQQEFTNKIKQTRENNYEP